MANGGSKSSSPRVSDAGQEKRASNSKSSEKETEPTEPTEPTEADLALNDYEELLKEIDRENETIADMKETMNCICGKDCKTESDYKEFQRLRCCLDNEIKKMDEFVLKAMCLQQLILDKKFSAIELPTTLEEDCTEAQCQFSCTGGLAEACFGAELC